MTDARLPGRWLTDPTFDGLTDRQWRTWTNSLMFAAEHGLDGKLTVRALRLLHPEGTDAETANALVTAGLWLVTDDGYEVADWSGAAGQSPAVDVARQRELNRQRQARWRAAQRTESDPAPSPVTDAVTRDEMRESPGQAKARRSYDVGELSVTSALESAKTTGCYECQRLAAFGQPACPQHRGAA